MKEMLPHFGIFVNIIAGIVFAVTPGAVQGQISVGAIKEGMGKALREAMAEQKSAVRVSTSLMTVDPKKRTTTIEFSNQGDDSVSATIEIWETDPRSAVSRKDSMFVQEDTTKPHLRLLKTWFADVPKTIRLAPHETKSVTVHLNVPPNSPPGEYMAWILATTEHAFQDTPPKGPGGPGKVRVGVNFSPGSVQRLRSMGKIVLTVE